jgi:hypothetical protein
MKECEKHVFATRVIFDIRDWPKRCLRCHGIRLRQTVGLETTSFYHSLPYMA